MPKLNMSVRSIDDDGVVVVDIGGALQDVKAFEEFMATAVIAKKLTRVVFDCQHLTFVNSSGLGALVKYSQKLGESGGAIALLNLQRKVRIVIDMLGLDSFFFIAPNLEEARQKMGLAQAVKPLSSVRLSADPNKFIDLKALTPPPNPEHTAIALRFVIHDLRSSLLSVQTRFQDFEAFISGLDQINERGCGTATLRGRNEGELIAICPGEYSLRVELIAGAARALVTVAITKETMGSADIPFKATSEGRFSVEAAVLREFRQHIEGLLCHVKC